MQNGTEEKYKKISSPGAEVTYDSFVNSTIKESLDFVKVNNLALLLGEILTPIYVYEIYAFFMATFRNICFMDGFHTRICGGTFKRLRLIEVPDTSKLVWQDYDVSLSLPEEMKLELERLRSEDTPPPHDHPYHWVILDPKSKEDKVKPTNLKNSPKFWSCLIRCANI